MPARAPASPPKTKRSAKSRPARAADRGHAAADAPYQQLVRALAGEPRVTLPAERRGKFGTNGLKVDGRIFAMWVRGQLAVKLPAAEIEAAMAAGRGERLAMGSGRVMKEWMLVHAAPRTWPAIARRALAYVGSSG